MDEVYTPNKSLGRHDTCRQNFDMDSPAVYVPTPINIPVPSTSTQKQEEHTSRSYGAGIRVVKRKPKYKPETSEEPSNHFDLNKRRATEDGGKYSEITTTSRMHPIKSILRSPHHASRGLSISFADSKNLPLLHIKEIERIAAIHSNVYDFRCSERNEGADLRHGFDDTEDVEWGLLGVKNVKIKEWDMTDPARQEVQRLEEAGIMRGVTFGIYTLQCIPELNDLAASDFAEYKPTNIPTSSVPTEPAKVNALRDLPLPGRKRNSGSSYNQEISHQRSPDIHMETPTIQQVFREPDHVPGDSYFTSTTSEDKSPPQTSTNFELPANLKLMLQQLKKKGILSNEEPAPSQPAPVDPMTIAMQAAQQMMAEQSGGNTYSSEEYTGADYGYVATFATPEMKAQERQQNSRNSEGWTQSGWKIHEPCVYFINKPQGCNRGDNCRFIHDDELRQRTQTELSQRGYQRDMFRGGERRGRGGFRGGFHNNGHQSYHNNGPSYHDQHNGGPRQEGRRMSRFQEQNQDGNRGGRYNNQRGGYVPRGSRFDKKEDINVNFNQLPPNYNQLLPNYPQPLPNNQESVQYMNQPPPSNHNPHYQYAGSPNEISDKGIIDAQDSGSIPSKRQRISRFDRADDAREDMDQRPQRKSRFDDRLHRSRFDQPAHQI